MSDNSKPIDDVISNDNDNDDILIDKAEKEAAEERLLVAARLLKQVRDQSRLASRHHTILHWAAEFEIAIKDSLSSPDDLRWKKQGESHGDYDFMVYYRIDPNTNQLACRIDSAIPSSLLIPVLAVFNESSLYKTWMPSYEKPVKLGIQETNMLRQESSRGNQIIQVKVNMAWPMLPREVILHTRAVDSIDEQGMFALRARSETTEENPVIPEPDDNVVRMDMEHDFIFQTCPLDHPCLLASKNNCQDPMILFTAKTRVNAHVKYVPLRLINFVTRNFIGRLWASNLKVAEEIRDGKRPLHQEAIASKRDLYDWVENRIAVMTKKANNK